MLTEKSKIDFEKWFRTNVPLVDINIFNHTTTPFSMQFGVFVDFFDYVGVNIFLTVEFDFGYVITEDKYQEIEEVKKWFEDRNTARMEALKMANDIYNLK